MSRVFDRDRGARALTRRLEKLARAPRVTVGVHADTGEQQHDGPSEATVREVATFNEFGTAKQQPRSFVRASVDEKERDIERGLAKAAEHAARRGVDIDDDVLREVGESVADRMRSRVPAETGSLRDAIEVRVGEQEGDES
ncbi:MAG: hypothetical protein SangKO_075660 [Sandaracinaceae bacterium]